MIAFRGTEEQSAKGKELVEKLLEAETAAREKRAEEDRLWHEEENKKWKEEKAAAKAARAAAGLDEEEEEEDKKDEEEGGHGASLSQFAVNPLGGTGNYAVNSPRSKSAAKRARKKAGGKTGGPTNIDDMSDEQVLNLLLGSDTKRAEAAKAKLLDKKEKEEKEKAAKKAAAKKAFEAKEKAEEAARQAEFKKINAKYRCASKLEFLSKVHKGTQTRRNVGERCARRQQRQDLGCAANSSASKRFRAPPGSQP